MDTTTYPDGTVGPRETRDYREGWSAASWELHDGLSREGAAAHLASVAPMRGRHAEYDRGHRARLQAFVDGVL